MFAYHQTRYICIPMREICVWMEREKINDTSFLTFPGQDYSSPLPWLLWAFMLHILCRSLASLIFSMPNKRSRSQHSLTGRVREQVLLMCKFSSMNGFSILSPIPFHSVKFVVYKNKWYKNVRGHVKGWISHNVRG